MSLATRIVTIELTLPYSDVVAEEWAVLRQRWATDLFAHRHSARWLARGTVELLNALTKEAERALWPDGGLAPLRDALRRVAAGGALRGGNIDDLETAIADFENRLNVPHAPGARSAASAGPDALALGDAGR